jgi:predicted TPR repeat methyltransferase
VAEITGFLQTRIDGFDVIVACDTFNYFGDLSPVLDAVAAALRPLGSLIFTVERRQGESSRSIQLDTTGRYSHTQDYVEAALSASRLAVDSVSMVQLRREAGQPVEAMLVQARRDSGGNDNSTSSQGE